MAAASLTLRVVTMAALGVAAAWSTGAVRIRQVSDGGFGGYEASLAPLGNGFAVAWYDTRHGHAEIYARVVDGTGGPAGPELRLTRGNDAAYEPDIAVAGSDLVVAWYERGPGSKSRAILGSWSSAGDLRWTRPLSTDGRSGRNPVVRVRGEEIFCAWLDSAPAGTPEVRAQWFGLNGEPRGASIAVGPASPTTWNLNATLDGPGLAWLAFDATTNTQADEIFLGRVERTGSRTIRLTSDDGKKSKYPDLAFSQGRLALTWFDERDGNQEVYLLVVPVGNLKEGIERRAVRVTNTPGESIGAYLAWNGGTIGLAWCDNSVGQDEIYFEPFDLDGRPRRPATRITHNPTQSLIPAIHSANEGFALVWNEFTPGPKGGHDPRGRSQIVFARTP